MKTHNNMEEQITINGQIYFLHQVYDTDGLSMVNKLKPMQISRCFDKYVYRTKEGIVMACYVNDVTNCWDI